MTRSRSGYAVVAVVLAAVMFAACGDDGDDAAPPTTTSTTTTSTTTTTTSLPVGPPTTRGLPEPVEVDPLPASMGSITVLTGEPPYRGVLGQIAPDRFVVAPVALPPAPAADGVAPLTGLPLAPGDDDAEDRPAILVKLDNTSRGRPQAALTQADLVYEEQVEGGVTRLAAVFQSATPELGPVRSGRTTDIAMLGSLNRPIFAWSGANRVHAALLRQQDIVDLGAQTLTEYTRASDRPGPYDLMVDATALLDRADDGEAPPPHFEYRDETIGLPPTAEPAELAEITFPASAATWEWTDDGWARTQNGSPHTDASGEQVVAANVVVAEVDHVATGSVDTAGGTVYEELFIGSGPGWVFTDGHAVEVTWTKPSIESVPTWTTPDGVPVAMTPGTTWVELVPAGGLDWS